MNQQNGQAPGAKDLWTVYREVMSRPPSADELRGFGRQSEGGASTTPYADIKFVNRRGRKGVSVTIGLKGTF